MFSIEQPDYEFNWEDVTDNYREMSYRELESLASEMGIVVEIIE